MPKRNIEREFGVPIAGEILDRSQWTHTSLKALPEQGSLDVDTVFGRRAPFVLDLGCGNGRFLIGSAFWRRDHDHLGVDVLPLVIRYAVRRANQRGLCNIRFTVADALPLLQRWIAPHRAMEIHCYHPQPYHDPRQAHRRLITPEFLTLVHRAVTANGRFYIQTDHPGYWEYIRQTAPVFFEFTEQKGPWPDAPKGRTRREIIAMRRGLPVFRGYGVPRPNISAEQALELAKQLPPPRFGPDPRSLELDSLELSLPE